MKKILLYWIIASFVWISGYYVGFSFGQEAAYDDVNQMLVKIIEKKN